MPSTTVAFYIGTVENFMADALAGTSTAGSFIPLSSGFNALHGALNGGMAIKPPVSIQAHGPASRFLWMLVLTQ